MNFEVLHLYISPGHNFFGRHGQPAGQHPTCEVPEVHCVAGHGLKGDRFFDFNDDYKGQITFFAMEVIEAHPGLHLLLGDLYTRTGLTDLAAESFDEAQFLMSK